MANENIFLGLKVVDLSSFIAGPGAAVILSDFGAEVIKVEPPHGDPWRHGHKTPIQPHAEDPYQWHLANRNKRSIALDLKSQAAQQVLFELANWADVFIVNTPHHARKKLKLEYDDVAGWNPRLIYADLTGFGENGPDANLPGFDLTSFWARSGLLSLTRDAGAPPTWPVSGSGDNATAVGLYSAIVTALYRRERTGRGSYVTTSLLAEGVWSASVSVQAALAGAKFPPMHDRKHPASAAMNVYRAADGTWFVLVIPPDRFAAVANAMGRSDLLTDPRFSDPAQLLANMPQLTAIFDEVFGTQPMAHWHSVFANVNVTFGEVRGPQEVINDPQLTANEIIVPLEGAGGKLTSTISSPIQVHGVAKVQARRAPALGEHTEEVLGELGFDATSIESLRESGAIAASVTPAAAQVQRQTPERTKP
jgi:formyl-CoA transferase